MRERKRFHSRFDDSDADPLAGMANLADVMLVFACGLLTALVMGQIGARIDSQGAPESQGAPQGGVTIEKGREVPDLARGAGGGVSGYESVGQVYRDPRTGKLVLVGK